MMGQAIPGTAAPAAHRPDHGAARPATIAGPADRRFLWAGGLVLAAVLAWVFRQQLLNGGTVLFGDTYDARIALAIQEHWSGVFAGRWAWHTVPWFLPWPRTLAYNDGYLLHGALHALARKAGADVFLAGEVANAALLAVMFAATALLLRRRLRLPAGWALGGAALACTADNYVRALIHAQFFALGCFVLAGLLFWTAMVRLAQDRRRAALAWGAAAGLLCGAVLLTSAYVAWAGMLLLALAAVVFAATLPVGFRSTGAPGGTPGGGRSGWAVLRRAAPVGAAMAGIAVLALLPALWLYLPVVQKSVSDTQPLVRDYAPNLLDLVSVGPGNLLWSWIEPAAMRAPVWLRPNIRVAGGAPMGIAPGLLLAAGLGIGIAVRELRRGRGTEARVVLALGVAAVVLVLVTVDFGGFWAWPWVVRNVPGARGFRALVRMTVLLGPVFAIVAVWGLARSGWPRPVTAAIGLFLMVEQVNLDPPVHLDRVAENRHLALLAPPPPGCAAFAAARPREGVVTDPTQQIYSHNVEAMLAAAILRLPTVNGFSSINPGDWDFADPNQRAYGTRVRHYAGRHDLEDRLCGVDFRTGLWTAPGAALAWQRLLPPARPVLPDGGPQAIGGLPPGTADAWLDEGWSGLESWGAWTDDSEAVLVVGVPPTMRAGGRLRLTAHAFAPDRGARDILLGPTGHAPQRWRVPDGEAAAVELTFSPEDVADGILTVRLLIPEPRLSPRRLGMGNDNRRLGIGLRALEWRPAP